MTEKIKKIFQKIRSIKNIEIIIAIAICVLAVVIYFSVSAGKNKKDQQTVEITDTGSELSAILSEIKGAGKTKVMISYDGEGTVVPAETTNTSSTMTTKNGEVVQKSSESKNTIIVNSGGVSGPVILEKKSPDIIGIIVVAEGAKDPEVAIKLVRAVQTVTGVTADKIRVFEMK